MPNTGVPCCCRQTVHFHCAIHWLILSFTTRWSKIFHIYIQNIQNICHILINMCLNWSSLRFFFSPPQRCIYASCNCEKNEDCLCAVFSSYARACASKGVFLTGWRENVCGKDFFYNIYALILTILYGLLYLYIVHQSDKYSKNCPSSQTFTYKNQRCQMTCSSLGSVQQSCSNDFLPVDGCTCAEGLYLNDEGICVPMAKCPCFYNEGKIKPGKSFNIKDEHWWVSDDIVL